MRALSTRYGAASTPSGDKSVWCEFEAGSQLEPLDRPVESLLELWSAEDM